MSADNIASFVIALVIGLAFDMIGEDPLPVIALYLAIIAVVRTGEK